MRNDKFEEALSNAFNKSGIDKTSRLIIKVDDVKVGMSVVKPSEWNNQSLADVLDEVVRMLRAEDVESSEIF